MNEDGYFGQGVRKMNIQQYYEQSATASLNGSLVAFIPSIILLIYAVVYTYILVILLLLPFLIYSFFCYQKFLLNQKRSKAVNLSSLAEDPIARDLLTEKQLLVTFLPAPSLRLLLFAANGIKVGEIRDQSFSPIRWFLPYFIDRLFVKKFGLYDQDDQPVVFYHYYKDRIELFTGTGEAMSILHKLKNGRKKAYILENNSVTIEKNSLAS